MRYFTTPPRSLRSSVAACLAVACLGAPALADTFLSGFEETPGDPITPLATVGDEWTTVSGDVVLEYVSDGATEGSQALSVTHNPTWTHSLQLDTYNLLDHVRLSDTLEFDLTVNSFNADWRQVFVVMQGAGLGWSQVGFDLDVGLGIEEFATTNIVLDLANPNGDGSANWKAAAQASRETINANNGEGAWWQIHLIFQGNDLTGEPQVATIIDNMRFVGGPLPLDGDFNADGVVDAADYTAWRDGLGGEYEQSDYDTWAANYATNIANIDLNAAVAVPEPTTIASLVIACFGACGARRRS
ncbi:hypothetical protein MalM25_18400 [Planctomycetes bacterium MalM25]|nr:hypothetical protein MalM25_18400 [Planctomycetes bacterium MalM25]